MYKYMCVVSDSTDEQIYYNTVAEIKKLYPDCTEGEIKQFDDDSMGQIIDISQQVGDPFKVCVKIDYSRKKSGQVVVEAENYLDKFFSDKKVSDNFSYSVDRMGRAARIGVSIAFLAVNIIASHILFWGFEWQLGPNLIISAFLAAVYTVSSLLMEETWSTGTFKTLFIQMGGIPFCIALLLSIAYMIIDRGWGAVFVYVYAISYIRTVPVALAISKIVTSIIGSKNE